MKKLLLLLLLLPFMVEAQQVTRDEYLKGTTGKPTWTPANNNSYAPDYKVKQLWKYNKTNNTWAVESDTNVIKLYFPSGIKGDKGDTGSQGLQGPKGDKGDQGVQGIQGSPGIGIQGPQGIQGAKGDTGNPGMQGPQGTTGPQGIKGDKGDPGVGIQGPKGDKGDTGNCTGCPSGGTSMAFPFIVVISNGVDDTPTIQRAVDSSYVNAKNIALVGYLKMGSGVKIKKDHRFLSVSGWAHITATNTNTWTFFYSDLPANNGEAEGVMTFRRIMFSNIELHGQGQAQTGFDLMATEGAIYQYLWLYDMKLGINVSFGLRNKIDFCEVNGSIDGVKVISGAGRWTGATNSNSCSNGTLISYLRTYNAVNTNVALEVSDASNVEINYFVIEGGKVNIGLLYNAMSTTSTGLNVRKIHYECAQVAGTAVVKIRSSTMNHAIIEPAFGKQSIYVMVDNGGVGYPNVTISDISSNRIYWNGVDKIFHNTGGNWTFSNCDDPMRQASELQKMFTGTPVQQGSGPNSFRITNPINR
jgi:hypothetical protein